MVEEVEVVGGWGGEVEEGVPATATNHKKHLFYIFSRTIDLLHLLMPFNPKNRAKSIFVKQRKFRGCCHNKFRTVSINIGCDKW